VDYLAFGLLGIGVILIVSGIFFSNQARNIKINIPSVKGREETLSEMARNSHFSQNTNNVPESLSTIQKESQVNQGSFNNNLNQYNSYQATQFSSLPPIEEKINEQVASNEHRPNIHIAKSNPKLFNKKAHLYLDSNLKNRYSNDDENFNIQNVSGIRRFGEGYFSYDGFVFKFEHKNGTETFPMNSISNIGFYPSCISIVLKNDSPTALFFLNETESIEKIIGIFKIRM